MNNTIDNVNNVSNVNKQFQFITMIDWDDTLFPTSWINDTDINLDASDEELIEIRELFLPLDIILCDFMEVFKKRSELIIVTNGSETWIKKCMNLLPLFSQMYEYNLFGISSARDLFEKDYPKKYKMWKFLTFQIHICEKFEDDIEYQHILSIGDSKYEHRALFDLENWKKFMPKKDRLLKSVIFEKKPIITELIEQINKLMKMTSNIFETNNSLTYKYDKTTGKFNLVESYDI